MTTPIWKTEPNRLTWYDDYTGLRCHIVRHPDGHLCGFVRIPGKFASKFSRKVPDIKHWLLHDLDLTPHGGADLKGSAKRFSKAFVPRSNSIPSTRCIS